MSCYEMFQNESVTSRAASKTNSRRVYVEAHILSCQGLYVLRQCLDGKLPQYWTSHYFDISACKAISFSHPQYNRPLFESTWVISNHEYLYCVNATHNRNFVNNQIKTVKEPQWLQTLFLTLYIEKSQNKEEQHCFLDQQISQ